MSYTALLGAAGSSDPAVFILGIAVLEAERDMALRLLALERAKERLQLALDAVQASIGGGPN